MPLTVIFNTGGWLKTTVVAAVQVMPPGVVAVTVYVPAIEALEFGIVTEGPVPL